MSGKIFCNICLTWLLPEEYYMDWDGTTNLIPPLPEHEGLTRSQRKNRKKRVAAKATSLFGLKTSDRVEPLKPNPENVGLTKSQRKNRKRRQKKRDALTNVP